MRGRQLPQCLIGQGMAGILGQKFVVELPAFLFETGAAFVASLIKLRQGGPNRILGIVRPIPQLAAGGGAVRGVNTVQRGKNSRQSGQPGILLDELLKNLLGVTRVLKVQTALRQRNGHTGGQIGRRILNPFEAGRRGRKVPGDYLRPRAQILRELALFR